MSIEDKTIFVAGCGGLGCYVVENLIRLKVGKIIVCDGDVFSTSNLNRQLYSNPNNIGQLKVECAKSRALELGFAGDFIAVPNFLDADNAESLIQGVDIVIDALDNTAARFILEDTCGKLNIPLIHGAVGTWNYQIAVVMPGSKLLRNLYEGKLEKNSVETFAFTVEACSAAQTAEAYKLLTGEDSELINSLLIADLKDNTYEIIKMG